MNEKLELWRKQKKELGLTNKDIADEANLPLRTVEQVMCGTVKSPRLDTVQAIERALKLDDNSAKNDNFQIPEKYGDVFVALNDGDKNLTQDDVDDIVKFIEFKKSFKK